MYMQLTNTVSARDVQRQYKKIFARVNRTKKPVVVISDNKPQAAIVSLDMLEEYERARDFAVIDEIQALNRDKDPDEVMRDVTEAVEEVRQEMHGKKKTKGSR